jgi:hypothetical protein
VQVPNANAVGFEKVYEQGDTPFCAGFGRWMVEFWPAMQFWRPVCSVRRRAGSVHLDDGSSETVIQG